MTNIPEKPSLDGIEARWMHAVGGRRHLPLRPHGDAATRCSRSTRPRRLPVARCTSATCSATPTPTRSPASSACAASTSSTRSAGTTTAWRPSVACRTSPACAATRRCRTTPTSARRSTATCRRITARSRSAGPTSSSLCHDVIHDDEDVFEQLVRRLGISIDWSLLYTTIGESSAAGQPAGVPAQPAARRGVPAGRADALRHRRTHRGRAGRDGRPRRARRVPQGRVPSQLTAPATC